MKSVKWLVGYTLASMVAGFVVVRMVDYFLSGLAGGLASAAKATAFSSAWTAVTSGAGMRAFTQRVRQVRQGVSAISRRIDRL